MRDFDVPGGRAVTRGFAGRFACAAGVLACLAELATAGAADAGAAKRPTMAEVIAASTPADWRSLDPADTVYLTLDSGRVVIELAPAFAPEHAGGARDKPREPASHCPAARYVEVMHAAPPRTLPAAS